MLGVLDPALWGTVRMVVAVVIVDAQLFEENLSVFLFLARSLTSGCETWLYTV